MNPLRERQWPTLMVRHKDDEISSLYSLEPGEQDEVVPASVTKPPIVADKLPPPQIILSPTRGLIHSDDECYQKDCFDITCKASDITESDDERESSTTSFLRSDFHSVPQHLLPNPPLGGDEESQEAEDRTGSLLDDDLHQMSLSDHRPKNSIGFGDGGSKTKFELQVTSDEDSRFRLERWSSHRFSSGS